VAGIVGWIGRAAIGSIPPTTSGVTGSGRATRSRFIAGGGWHGKGVGKSLAAAAEELEARRRQDGLSHTGLNKLLRRPERPSVTPGGPYHYCLYICTVDLDLDNRDNATASSPYHHPYLRPEPQLGPLIVCKLFENWGARTELWPESYRGASQSHALIAAIAGPLGPPPQIIASYSMTTPSKRNSSAPSHFALNPSKKNSSTTTYCGIGCFRKGPILGPQGIFLGFVFSFRESPRFLWLSIHVSLNRTTSLFTGLRNVCVGPLP